MHRSALLGILLLASCVVRMETPRGATANNIEVSYASSRGVLWGAALRLSEEGRLISVEVPVTVNLMPALLPVTSLLERYSAR